MQVLRKLLFPISLVYALIVFLRNRFYDWGIFSSRSFETKILCVGNLSVGGTGKTPMIELLVEMLRNKNRIAVLSRGYKRKSSGFVLATTQTSVQDLGDEPFQLKSKYPTVQVAVDADRRNGITQLETIHKPDVILLDDAFQHRRVKPDFAILLTAFTNLYSEDWYLPTGNLRDGKMEAHRADIIVVTKCPDILSLQERNEIKRKLAPEKDQELLFSFLSYNTTIKGNGTVRSLIELKSIDLTLVTGIANPKPLVDFLKKEGLSFKHLRFNDHHFFSEKELASLRKEACILTTEKDYVRLKDELTQLYYIEVKHEFLDNGKEVFYRALHKFMTVYS